jgi:hypothetical protein
MATSASPSTQGLGSNVVVGTLVCPDCGGPIDDGASGVISTILAQLDRFGLAGRSAPLLAPRREDG